MINSENNQEPKTVIEILEQIKANLIQALTPRAESLKESLRMHLLTLEDVQDLLQISLSTANRFIREEILPSRKIGSRYYFYEEDIHNALEKQRKKKDEDENQDNLKT